MRYIRFNTEKEQINLYGINQIDKWRDTCKTRATTFIDVCEASCDCDIYDGDVVPPTPTEDDLAFEFSTVESQVYRINNKVYTASTSPFSVNTKADLGINEITDLHNLFNQGQSKSYVNKVTKLPDSHLVTDISRMFYVCNEITSLDLTSLDVSNVTMMIGVFDTCSSLVSIDLSGWNMMNVIETRQMFYQCFALKTIYMRNCNQATIDKIKNQLAADNISGVTIITQ